ncbi:hypothetical protein AVEN_37423-1 [Araneus ventricosus]|uniref:BTB domain-containing protein n=1 Tax=Araneus ventricosus TaxID=182803 RepID=A0A4Y2UYE1_ARAVE|nr:hypothetical protein AVEN_37423-1 [Araneus ventricosus]
MVARIVSIRAPLFLRPPLFISMAKSNYFTYVWAVENVNMFYRKPVKSPSFQLPSVESLVSVESHPEFCIKLCLEDKDDPGLMAFNFLRKSSGERFVEVNDMDYELSILASDGSCLIKREFFSTRDKIQQGFYVPRDEVLVQRKSAFLPNNTLTLQCKMSLSKIVNCFARTRLRIEKQSVLFIREDFRYSEKNSEYAQDVTICCEEKPEVTFIPYLVNDDVESEDEESDNEVSNEYENNEYESDDDESDDEESDAFDCYTCKVSLSDALGNEECVLDETRIDFNKDGKITLPLTKKSKSLRNDALFLNCLLTSYSGASLEEIEFVKYGNSDHHEYSSIFFNEDKDEGASTLKDELRSLYDDQILCDFTIQTEAKLFSVHKSILISRSPIFRSMIMNCVERDLYISDADSETMHRFLLYLYTDKVEDMEWKNALKLYVVAEQFKISTLMKKCSLILTEKLTIQNVCDILLLAYKYHDEDMKSSIHDFISVQDVAFFNSDKWIKMEETNSSIAAETFRLSSR